MQKFVRSLITEWRKLELPFEDATIIVAVSGGADSMSLLLGIHDLLERRKLRLDVVAAHFNHGLRGQASDDDESFVRKRAAELGVDFVAGHGRGKPAANLEEKARVERYRFLAELGAARKARWVLTAHTINDQAETFLLNLIRGSGAEGLAGMPLTRQLDHGVTLARPLLTWATRDDTEKFCLENSVSPRTDLMNSDERFTRVKIRRTVIPQLAEINPKIVATLARTAELLRGQIATDNDSDIDPGETLLTSELLPMTSAEIYTALRGWLKRSRGSLRSLELEHIKAIERLIRSRKSGKTVELPGGGRVVKEQGRLVFRNIKVEK